jgi:hypothetical protein
MERVMGIEPTSKAWEAFILPLNYTRAAKAAFSIFALGVSIFLFATYPAHAFSENWREEAKAMLEEGQQDAALALMSDVRQDVPLYNDPVERINTLRYLGELYWEVNKPKLARESFHLAMTHALDVEPVWKKLTVVISVLELQRKTKDTGGITAQIQRTLQVQLPVKIAADVRATEIGRYIRTFDKYGSPEEIVLLMQQIREMKKAGVRKKALFAVNDIRFRPLASAVVDSTLLYPPFEADAMEKLMWYAALSRLFNTQDDLAQAELYASQASALYERLPADSKPSAKKILKKLNQKED